MSDTDITWMDGSVVEDVAISPFTQRLIAQAQEDGFNRGYKAGRKLGRTEGFRAATTVNTALSQRHVAAALRLIDECGAHAEDERSSVYWSEP